MANIKLITVRVEPFHTARPGQVIEHQCRIDVEFFGRPTYHGEEIIPDDEFTRRFDWMLERTKLAVNELISRTEL